jgi:hypothetical protein
MVSDADKKGLRHKERHKIGIGPISDLMRPIDSTALQQFLEASRLHPEISFMRRWRVYRDPDLRADAAMERLWKLWPRLSVEDRDLYLRTAESIAAAELAKNGSPGQDASDTRGYPGALLWRPIVRRFRRTLFSGERSQGFLSELAAFTGL